MVDRDLGDRKSTALSLHTGRPHFSSGLAANCRRGVSDDSRHLHRKAHFGVFATCRALWARVGRCPELW